MPDNSVGLPHAILERTQRHYFEFLERHSDFAGNYLELGPDIGLFTQHVPCMGRTGCLWLYEPNLAVHDMLARRLAGRDVRIHAEMADFSAIPDDSVSVCVMIHVLDHLPNAKPLLQQIRRKLRAGARVFIVTHDERSLLARAFGRRWPAYCLQHSQLFNISTTERFLRECGLVVIETKKSKNYFPATYLLKHLSFAIGLRRLSMKIKGDSFVIPLRLGNIMTIARSQ
jgi:SAM-dependent methyltransferase